MPQKFVTLKYFCLKAEMLQEDVSVQREYF